MAASIPWNALRGENRRRLRVLDPMSGSGTTLVVARTLGHQAIGFDTDPLAAMLASVWCADVNEAGTLRVAEKVLERAERAADSIAFRNAYPIGADEDTRAFVRYWFERTNRRQLAALSRAIGKVTSKAARDVLWCAFSRLIITKQAGVSLALDVSHSRPHRVEGKSTIRPFDHFLRAVGSVVAGMPFKQREQAEPKALVRMADARALPVERSSIDVVISSPPYLNAIDYLRGHRMSLVWMGHSVGDLRTVRAGNIGTEAAGKADPAEADTARILKRMGNIEQLPDQQQRLLARYVSDMDKTIGEMHRVLVRKGRALLVIGDCTMAGVFVRNSSALAALGQHHGFDVVRRCRRPLPPNRRYLPPPSARGSGSELANRMRTEVLLEMVKQ